MLKSQWKVPLTFRCRRPSVSYQIMTFHSNVLMPFVTQYLLHIFRSLSNPLLHRYVHLWNTSVPAGGFHWTIPWRRRDERDRTDLPHLQGRRILGYCYGFPRSRLLHHHRSLDYVLHLELVVQHWQWSSLG